MVAIIVAAHGESAPALLATAGMILGDFDHVSPVSFMPGQGPEDLLEDYRSIVHKLPADEGVLFLVDLFGGSPYNAAARFASERENTDVIAGVNLPMLLEVISAAARHNATLERLAVTAHRAGTGGIRSFRDIAVPHAEPPAAQEATVEPAADSTVADHLTPAQPGGHMDVVFLRIDSRLIHGQVAGSWVNNIAPHTLIAASDTAAHDQLRKTLLLQVAPSHIKTNVLDIAKTGRVYHNPKYTGMKTMIVVESPRDALRLLDEGIKVAEINVGGVTFKPGMKQVSDAVYATDEDIRIYRDIADRGITLTLQQVPHSNRDDLIKRLTEKGLLP